LAENKLGRARAKYYEFNQAAIVHNRNATEERQRPLIDFFDNGVNPHPQPLVVTDNSLPDAFYPDGTPLEKFRQLSEKEMVLLNISRKMIDDGFGWLMPLEEQHYLKEDKIQELSIMVDAYNSAISQLVGQYSDRVTLVDIKTGVLPISESGKTDAWGDPINSNIVYFNGVPVEGSLGLNSIFSLDGLHFNQRGNAFVANAFIRQINKAYNAQIPLANINDYIGNIYHF
jgi:hypothetical protein